MAKVSMSLSLPVPIEQAWRLIGGFNALPEWHPAVEKSELQDGGRLRRLQIAGGATLVERLDTFNENDHCYTYTIEQGPLPVAQYKATIRLRQETGKPGCIVDWSSEFTPSGAPEGDAVAAIRNIYQAGFDNLKRMFGG
jgi:hypothetical protein